MPVIDLNQGFYQVAKHYYFPGWHQQTSLFELLVSIDRWNELSLVQQAQIEIVCEANFVRGAAMGEAAQSKALARAGGARSPVPPLVARDFLRRCVRAGMRSSPRNRRKMRGLCAGGGIVFRLS